MKQKKSIELSIIILSYNTKDVLRDCLTFVVSSQTKADKWEIIVVDNASIDGSVEMVRKEYPTVRVIPKKSNLGYSAGNNVGIKQSKGKYVLLLNSDTEVSKDAIRETLTYLKDHKEVGVATCRLLRPDGSMDPACHRGFPTPWAALTYFIGLERLLPKSSIFGRYHLGFRNLSELHEIDSPSGAFYMIRRDVVTEVGFLDEQFFMYGEDLDWSYRIKSAGRKIIFYPFVSVFHKKWQSGKAHPDEDQRRQTQKYFFDAMQVFYKKHYQHRYGWFITRLVLFGIRLKSFL